ncbi:MAG: hypothetical protein EKK53_06400 [Burkholderiales bacterium]|nr:MAG: hypothetical protein EKK53_06400 [Burkholderiales bacterium]
MNDTPPLNAVQLLNFSFLSYVRDAARSDLASACCSSGLSPRQARSIGALTPEDVMQIVASTGNVLLFAPRDDIDTLLAAPRTVIPILASARVRGAARAVAEHPAS